MGFNNMNKGPPGKAFKDNKYSNEYRGDFRHKKNFNFKRKRDGYDRYQPDQRPKNENERPKPAFNIDRQDQDRRHGKPLPLYQQGNKSYGTEFLHGRPFNKHKGSFEKRYPVEGEAVKGTGFEQPRRLEASNDIESRRSEKREEERREIHKKELHKKELARIEAERREEERKEAEKKETERKETERKETEKMEIEKKENEKKENEKKEVEKKDTEMKENEKRVTESKEFNEKQPEKKLSETSETEKEAKNIEVNNESPQNDKDNNTEEDFDMSTNYSSPLGPLPSANSSLSDKGLHEPDMVKLSTIVEDNDNNQDYDSDVDTIVSDSEPSTAKAREIGRELDPDSNKSNSSEVVKSSKGVKKPYTMKRDASGSSLLQRACKKGNLNEVRDLLERGADPNECDFCGFTCLHEAALNGDIDIVRYLISKGADVNKQALPDGDLETPLIDAADNGHYEIVKLLLESGADPLIYNNDGYTALTKIFNIHKDDEGYDDIIKLLEEAHSKEKGSQKMNVSTARSPSPDQIVEDPNESYFKDLLKKKNHSSVIYKYAAEGVKDLAVQYIIEGGRLDYKPDIFILAARNGYVELVDILLGLVENFDINIQNACGLTALLASVGRNHLDVVKFLLERGADPFLRRKQDGFNALEISRKSPKFRAEEVELLESFMKKNPNYNVLTKSREVTDREVDVPPVAVNEKAPKLELAPSKQSTVDADKRVDLKRKDSAADIEIRKQKRQKSSPVENEPLTIKSQASSVFSKEKTPDGNANATKDISKSPQSHVERSKPSSPSPPPLSKKQEEMKAKNAMELKIYQEKLEAKKKARKDFFLKSEREKERKRKEEELKRLEEQKRLEILKQKQEEEKLKAIQQEAEKIVLQKKEMERKQIQAYYPVGLQHVKFGTLLKKEDIERFSPLFTFEFDNEVYVTDLHISLITGGSISELRKFLKDSEIKGCSFETKSKLWNIYFPLIGFYGPSNDLNKLLNDGHYKFQFLDICFVKMDSVESFIKEKFQLSYDLIWKQKKFTRVDLSSLRMFRAIETVDKTVTNSSINADAVGSFIPPNLKSRPEVVKAVHDNKIPSW